MNAKEEFMEHINDRVVKCAGIWLDRSYGKDVKPFNLCQQYSNEQYIAFINSLDFKYDAGFGGQELYGTIWYEDGTWSERGEYDGSEWWEHHVCPEIPEGLK